MNDDERLKELRAKESLNDAEFNELISLSPKGTFVSMPSMQIAGLHDHAQATLNMFEITERIGKALTGGFFVEAFALRAQVLELYLRHFLAAIDPKRAPMTSGDKHTLGSLIGEAAQKGLPAELVSRLREFNEGRINAIHKFMLGVSPYSDFGPLFKKSDGLVPTFMQKVAEMVGTKL